MPEPAYFSKLWGSAPEQSPVSSVEFEIFPFFLKKMRLCPCQITLKRLMLGVAVSGPPPIRRITQLQLPNSKGGTTVDGVFHTKSQTSSDPGETSPDEDMEDQV